jgi:peptidoglycan/LPS O-acetylase OafA/YrhL
VRVQTARARGEGWQSHEPPRPNVDVPAKRLPALDGLRGLAGLLAMWNHAFQVYRPEDHYLDHLVFGLAMTGWIGVDLFFVLSGFLITGILYDSKASPRYFVNFYGRRTLRVFPLYYAVLIGIYLLLPLVPHPMATAYPAASTSDQVWFWTYLSNFRIATLGEWYPTLIPNVTWSLAIEEQFYLVWPLVVLSFSGPALMRVCGVLFVTALGLRLALSALGAEPIVSYVLPFTRMDALSAGSFVAILLRTPGGQVQAIVWSRRLAPVALIMLLAIGSGDFGLNWGRTIVHTWGFSLVAVFFAAVTVLGITGSLGPGTSRLLETATLRMFGKYSYALYLLHGPVGTLVKVFYEPSASFHMGLAFPPALVFFLLTTLLSLAFAWLSWRLVEQPFIRLQRHFR